MVDPSTNLGIKEGYSFKVETHRIAEDEAIQQIEALQNKDLRNPDTFSVGGPITTEIADALHRTFESFVSRGIVWSKIFFVFSVDSDIDTDRLRDAMGVANRGSLFEAIGVETRKLEGEREADIENLRTDIQLLSSLEDNARLKELYLTRFALSAEDTVSLGRVLQQPTNLCSILIDCAMADPKSFLAALSSNSSLEKALIGHIQGGGTSDVVRALTGHPKLENLMVCNSRNDHGIPLIAVSELLSSSTCGIKKLHLHFRASSVPTGDFNPLLQGIRNNTSLETISSVYAFPGKRPLSEFLKVWKSHPTLRLVKFRQHFTIEDIQEAKDGPRSPRPLKIRNSKSRGSPNAHYDAAVKELLDAHPEICWDFNDLYSESTKHANCLNHCGRYLMYREIPLGLWPLVLARIKKTSVSANYKASAAVYEFLHGQPFAGRDNHVGASPAKSGTKRSWEAI
mmetsp:Transcript_29008/g.70053  ORF Transcript_29008/g.70053 Transcript_29008/m.70053 type:complete len:455 (-) Transcript_29008:244-1608(-)